MVRISEYLALEVERLANEERRSLAQMVEILLEQALKLEVQPVTKKTVQTEPVYVESQVTSTPRAIRREEDDHFKPDFGKKLK